MCTTHPSWRRGAQRVVSEKKSQELVLVCLVTPSLVHHDLRSRDASARPPVRVLVRIGTLRRVSICLRGQQRPRAAPRAARRVPHAAHCVICALRVVHRAQETAGCAIRAARGVARGDQRPEGAKHRVPRAVCRWRNPFRTARWGTRELRRPPGARAPRKPCTVRRAPCTARRAIHGAPPPADRAPCTHVVPDTHLGVHMQCPALRAARRAEGAARCVPRSACGAPRAACRVHPAGSLRAPHQATIFPVEHASATPVEARTGGKSPGEAAS